MFQASGQWLIFLAYTFTGAVIGLLYEICFFIRFCIEKGLPAGKVPKVLCVVADVVFFLAAGAAVLFLGGFINYNQIRFYVAAAVILGYVLERLSIHKLFAKTVGFVYNVLVKVSKKLWTNKLFQRLFK